MRRTRNEPATEMSSARPPGRFFAGPITGSQPLSLVHERFLPPSVLLATVGRMNRTLATATDDIGSRDTAPGVRRGTPRPSPRSRLPAEDSGRKRRDPLCDAGRPASTRPADERVDLCHTAADKTLPPYLAVFESRPAGFCQQRTYRFRGGWIRPFEAKLGTSFGK
jgi:hypothetical protein